MRFPHKSLVWAMLALTLSGADAQQTAQQTPLNETDEAPASAGPSPIVVGHPVHLIDPVVPKKLRKKSLAAVLYGTIATDGTFENLAIAGGDPEFTNPSLDAVRQWRYTPATQDGKPVDVSAYVIVRLERGKFKGIVEEDLPVATGPPKSAGEDWPSRVGGGMSPPRAIYAPDPGYSEAARAAKYQGVAVLGMIIGPDGNPKAVWIKKKLGLGLDQKAIQAVRQWRFQPATKDGKPVAVLINVEVTFRPC